MARKLLPCESRAHTSSKCHTEQFHAIVYHRRDLIPQPTTRFVKRIEEVKHT